MNTIPGYKINTCIYESERSRIHRGTHIPTGKSVIIKSRIPSPNQEGLSEHLQNEFDLLTSMHSSGSVHALDLAGPNASPVLILEDSGAAPLNASVIHDTTSLAEKITLFIHIVKALASIHDKRIIHKAIHPSNLLVNPDGSVVFCDFEHAEPFSKNAIRVERDSRPTKHLAYCSPEQTGRVSSSIDYRTDFYSLGIVFYQLLTGSLPFQSDDPLTLIHCHIAKLPILPSDMDQRIPLVLSSLVLKLIQKNSVDRYQSTNGILYDLQKIAELIGTAKSLDDVYPFTLGTQDTSGEFLLPQRLYGRGGTLTLLRQIFDSVVSGSAHVVSLTGCSGLGKSTLINEFRRGIVTTTHLWAEGKCAEIERGIPYNAILEALRDVVQHLLTLPPDEIEHWKTTLRDAVYPNGHAIIEAIPELNYLIGTPSPSTLPNAMHASHRFTQTLLDFIKALAIQPRPLVLAIDDLQWADSETIHLLTLLITDVSIRNVLVIATYRDDDDTSQASTQRLPDIFRQAPMGATTLTLAPLVLDDIHQLLIDTLHTTSHEVKALANIILAKSHGNPYFVYQLLEQLVDDNLIYFDREKRSWNWHSADISEFNLAGDIDSILRNKVSKLPTETLLLLKIAVCLGPRFSLKMLQYASGKTEKDIHKLTRHALQEGLLIEVICHASEEKDHRHSHFASLLSHGYFIFSHDKIRQAIYDLCDRRSKPKLHFDIANHLYRFYENTTDPSNILGLVKHFNLGKEYLSSAAQRRTVSTLNLSAAHHALHSIAYHASWDYASQALSLLPEDPWDNDYDLCLAIHQQLVESGFLSSRYKESERFARSIMEKANNRSDKSQCVGYLIQGYYAQDKKQEAIDTGIAFLSTYDIHFAATPSRRATLWELVKTRWQMRRLSVQDVTSFKQATPDAAMLEYGEIVNQLGMLSYRTAPGLLPLLILWGVRQISLVGLTKYSPISLASYGMMISEIFGNKRQGYYFGTMASALTQHAPSDALAFRANYICNATLNYWKNPIGEYADGFVQNFHDATLQGDSEIAQFSLYAHALYRFFSGDPIPQCVNRSIEYADSIAAYHQPNNMIQNAIALQAMANLHQTNNTPHVLQGEFYDITRSYRTHIAANDATALFKVHFFTMLLSYVFDEFPQAEKHAKKTIMYARGEIGMISTYLAHFYYGLILLKLYPESEPHTALRIRWKVSRIRRRFRRWAKESPANFENKLAILDAEYMATITTSHSTVFRQYDRAITLSERYGFVQEAAMIAERAADFCYSLSPNSALADGYIQSAHHFYQRWNSASKLQHFEQKFTLASLHTTARNTNNPTKSNTPLPPPLPDSSQRLDMDSVLKASQVLASHLVLSTLVEETMRLLVENAGAERGMLLLQQDGALILEATNDSQSTTVNSHKGLPLERCTHIAKSIVRYAYRTQEELLIENAQTSDRFSQDPHIRSTRVLSVLCSPLVNQGKTIGVLYLENNLSEGSFTEHHLEVVKILSSQSAISIEKSRIFEQLQDSNSHISHLLSVTKELNQAETKICAAQLALNHILALSSQSNIDSAILYLPNKNSASLTGFSLIDGHKTITNPTPFTIAPDEKIRLDTQLTITLDDHRLTIPLQSEQHWRGALVIYRWDGTLRLLSEQQELIEGIARSLTLSIDNLDAEENSRLLSIGTMAASIVHDLKNPIGAIIGYADMADSDALQRDSRSEYLSIIKKEATRMSDMAHEVLEFSAGNITLHKTRLSAPAFLQDVSETLSSTFHQAHMDYAAHCCIDEYIYIDVDRIRRVLLNLATNARDAMQSNVDNKGLFTLNMTKKHQGLCINVSDNGPGIPEQLEATLFEPFTTHGKSNGTGLGMAIVKKTIEAHGASIDFSTSPDGTQFTLQFGPDIFCLPQQYAATKRRPHQPIDHLQILLAEDNPVNQTLIELMLKKLGLTCVSVENGALAIDAMAHTTFDVILMDIEMPVLNGIDTTARIRQSNEPYADIPIIALTAHAGLDILTSCENVGVSAHIVKPISLATLEGALMNIAEAMHR